MALRNPKIFGLNVLSFLADLTDKEGALISLNLPPDDLDIIRGSSDAGVTRSDWMSLSGLSQPIYKILSRYLSHSGQTLTLLNSRAGTDAPLFGNLDINGSISGRAIRYRYLDGTGPTSRIKIADISTSRVSAWSTASGNPAPTDPIFYGGRVGITTGGKLLFGTPSNQNQVRLQTNLVPIVKEFSSEFPTSKITTTINGETVKLYAMKGIPVVFRGFFRNLNATIRLTSLISGVPASWKIVEVARPTSFSNFKNIGDTTSTIDYRSSSTRERDILFYYNPDRISSITINSANISTLPKSIFPNATSVNLSFNNLREFPDFTTITPTLRILSLIRNPFHQSPISSERYLNSSIIDKIPTTVRELYLGSTFYGSIDANAIGNRFNDLRVLNLSRNGSQYFHPDSYNSSSPIPNVSQTCEIYNVHNNDFRSISSSSGSSYNVKELDNLRSLDLSSNYYLTDSTFAISGTNEVIEGINITYSGLPCPTLSGRQSLKSFSAAWTRNAGSIFSGNNYKFDGCGSLTSLSFYGSGITGAIPKFTNPKITYIDFRYTNMVGGNINGDESYVIPERTFESSPEVAYFMVISNRLLTSPIHPNTFTFTPKLYYLNYSSYGRTTGNLPNISTCSDLTYLILNSNKFEGNVYNFSANPSIYYVDLSSNSLSGNIPPYKNLSNLRYLYLHNNKFESIFSFINLQNLEYFYAYNNLLSGTIPSFAECPRLYYLQIFNNKFENYEKGSFSKLYRIRFIDVSNNLLTQQAVNVIIDDLLINYNSVPRRGVVVNLRGNSTPGETGLEKIDILRSKGWTITYD